MFRKMCKIVKLGEVTILIYFKILNSKTLRFYKFRGALISCATGFSNKVQGKLYCNVRGNVFKKEFLPVLLEIFECPSNTKILY